MTYDSLRRLKEDLRLDQPGAEVEKRSEVRFGLWILERGADGEFVWRMAKSTGGRPDRP